MLAGLSVDYVVRLEQGRARHPSAAVLSSLARALRLSEEERDHLFRIGGVAIPSVSTIPRHIPPGVQHIVDRLAEVPVAVFSAAWDALLVNDLWLTLFDGPPLGGRDANLMWREFAAGTSRVRHTREGVLEYRQALVADARVAAARYPDDVALASLIADLRRVSLEFERSWRSATIAAHRESRKTVESPLVGEITFDCDVLSAPSSDLRLVVYTVVPGSPDADKLDLLRVSAVRTFAS